MTRLIDQIANLNNDPIFVGHMSERFARSNAWSTQGLIRFSDDPTNPRYRGRLNYFSCAIATTASEMLFGIEDVSILFSCQNEKIRSSSCISLLDSKLLQLDSINSYPRLPSVCGALRN